MAEHDVLIERIPLRVATLRWRAGRVDEGAVLAWLQRHHLPALPGAGGLAAEPGRGLWLARRGPGEAWLLERASVPASSSRFIALLRDDAPVAIDAAVRVVDLSEAVTVLRLRAEAADHRFETWQALLPRLTDASALPAQHPAASPCLIYDLPVLLLCLSADEAWLCVETPLAPTLADGLQAAARFDPPPSPLASPGTAILP